MTTVPKGLLQRKCACGGSPGAGGECAECQKKRLNLQRKEAGGGGPGTAPPIVHEVLSSPGGPLDWETRSFMEPRFGHDFSRVRIHADSRAAESAGAVHALAYTVGRDVVFGTGQYAPQTHEGRRLLAHELAHVIQQNPGTETTTPAWSRLVLGSPGDPSEHEAERSSEKVMLGLESASPATITSRSLQRTEEKKTTYVLKVPPPVQQNGMTCWAGALSSWLEVMGLQKITAPQIIERYKMTECLEPSYILLYTATDEVMAEWGIRMFKYGDDTPLTYEIVRRLLESYGHLILGEKGTPGHVRVVYAVGVPDVGSLSLMDPISASHKNIPFSSLKYPLYVGILTGQRVRPAPCQTRKIVHPPVSFEPFEQILAPGD